MEDSNEVNAPEAAEGRDYTRKSYQNFMAIVEALQKASPLPMTQKQIQEATGVSKNIVFDVCWNLVDRGWAEEAGDGAVRLKKSGDAKEAFIGRMMIKLVRDSYGVEFEEK